MEVTLFIIAVLAIVIERSLAKRNLKKRHARFRRLTYGSPPKKARIVIPFSEVVRHAMLRASGQSATKVETE